MNTSAFYKKNRSFTLIELLVVISIFGLFASIILTSLQGARDKARIAKSLQFSANIYHGLGVDMVGWWNFNEEGDNTCVGGGGGYDDFCDTSNNKNHGKNVNNTSRTSNSVIPQLGRAGQFPGNSYVEVADSSSLDLTSGITIEGWIKTNIITFQWRVASKSGAYILFFNFEYPAFFAYGTSNPYLGGTSLCPNPFVIGRWHHYVGTYDGSKMKIIVDGKEICSQDSSGQITANTYPLTLGFYTNGNIDEVRIYERGLTTAQIQKHYAEGAKKRGIAIEK